MYNKGPNLLPWGTALVTLNKFEKHELFLTLKFLSRKKSFIQLYTQPSIPKLSS